MGMTKEDMPDRMAVKQCQEVFRIIEHDQVHEIMRDGEGWMMHEQIERKLTRGGELGFEPGGALRAIEAG